MTDEITPKEEIQIETPIEPISKPVETNIPAEPEVSNPEPTQTTQIPVFEPLSTPEEPKPEPESNPETIPEESKSEPVNETPKPEIKEESKPEPRNENQEEPAPFFSKRKLRELLETAREKIQFKKRKKLDKILELLTKKSKITNDEIEKLFCTIFY